MATYLYEARTYPGAIPDGELPADLDALRAFSAVSPEAVLDVTVGGEADLYRVENGAWVLFATATSARQHVPVHNCGALRIVPVGAAGYDFRGGVS